MDLGRETRQGESIKCSYRTSRRGRRNETAGVWAECGSPWHLFASFQTFTCAQMGPGLTVLVTSHMLYALFTKPYSTSVRNWRIRENRKASYKAYLCAVQRVTGWTDQVVVLKRSQGLSPKDWDPDSGLHLSVNWSVNTTNHPLPT